MAISGAAGTAGAAACGGGEAGVGSAGGAGASAAGREMMAGAGRVVCGRIVRGARAAGASAGGAAGGAGAASTGFSTGFGATAERGMTTLGFTGPPSAGFAGITGSAFFTGSGSESFLIALRTSPGFEIFERSIFGLCSSLCAAEDADLLPSPLPDLDKARRTRSASSASSELECVFFSVIPTSVRTSSTCLLLTSSSRAKSLMRTFDIRPRCFLCS